MANSGKSTEELQLAAADSLDNYISDEHFKQWVLAQEKYTNADNALYASEDEIPPTDFIAYDDYLNRDTIKTTSNITPEMQVLLSSDITIAQNNPNFQFEAQTFQSQRPLTEEEIEQQTSEESIQIALQNISQQEAEELSSDTSFQAPADESGEGWIMGTLRSWFKATDTAAPNTDHHVLEEDFIPRINEGTGEIEQSFESDVATHNDAAIPPALESAIESITGNSADDEPSNYVERLPDDAATHNDAAPPARTQEEDAVQGGTIEGTSVEEKCDEITHFDMNKAVTDVQQALNTHLKSDIPDDGMFGKGTSAALDRVLKEAGLEASRDMDQYPEMIQELQDMDGYQELGNALAVMQAESVEVDGQEASALARVYNDYEPHADCDIDAPANNDGTIVIVADPIKNSFNTGGIQIQIPIQSYTASLMSTGHLKTYSEGWNQETSDAMQQDILSLQKEYCPNHVDGQITLEDIKHIRESGSFNDLDYNQKGAINTRLDFYKQAIDSGKIDNLYKVDPEAVEAFKEGGLTTRDGASVSGGIDSTISLGAPS